MEDICLNVCFVFQYVDLDEFLSENGIPMDAPAPGAGTNGGGGGGGALGGGILPTASTSPQQPPLTPQPQLNAQQLHKLQALSPDPDGSANGQDMLLQDASLLLQVCNHKLHPQRYLFSV